MKLMGWAVVCALAMAASGCTGNAYTQFYEPTNYGGSVAHPLRYSGQVQVQQSSGDLAKDEAAMYEDNYGLIGTAEFSGPMQDTDDAVRQAGQIGASHVIIASEYEETRTGTYTMTSPTTSTTNFGGMAGSTPYSGTATTYGTQTTAIPYSVNRYGQRAYFFAPLSREGLGGMAFEVPSELKQQTGTNSGVWIGAIRKGSPAYDADIVPGDIILTVAEKPITQAGFQDTIRSVIGKPAEFVIWRRGERLTKTITIPASW